MQFDNTTNSQCPKKSLGFNKPDQGYDNEDR